MSLQVAGPCIFEPVTLLGVFPFEYSIRFDDSSKNYHTLSGFFNFLQSLSILEDFISLKFGKFSHSEYESSPSVLDKGEVIKKKFLSQKEERIAPAETPAHPSRTCTIVGT